MRECVIRDVDAAAQLALLLLVGLAGLGAAHDDVDEWGRNYGEFGSVPDDAELVALRDGVLSESGNRWEAVSDPVQDVLLEVAAAGVDGISAGELSRTMSHLPGFTKRGPDRHGKALLRDLVACGFLRRAGGGGHARYRIGRPPAGAPWCPAVPSRAS